MKLLSKSCRPWLVHDNDPLALWVLCDLITVHVTCCMYTSVPPCVSIHWGRQLQVAKMSNQLWFVSSHKLFKRPMGQNTFSTSATWFAQKLFSVHTHTHTGISAHYLTLCHKWTEKGRSETPNMPMRTSHTRTHIHTHSRGHKGRVW